MEMPAKQTPAASSEMVKLIRKLRWVGLEEKAEQLVLPVLQVTPNALLHLLSYRLVDVLRKWGWCQVDSPCGILIQRHRAQMLQAATRAIEGDR